MGERAREGGREINSVRKKEERKISKMWERDKKYVRERGVGGEEQRV